MSGDEDWFERALREADERDGADGEGGDGDGEGPPGRSGAAEAGETGAESDGVPFGDDSFEGDTGAFFGDDVSLGESGSEDPLGDGPAFAEGGDESPFDDDFETAFGGSSETDFAEEDFESDVPRIDLGIEGLDDMILGGVPERHLIVCVGGAGSGKTTFGLQFLRHGLQNGEHGVFITLEQSYGSIIDTANGRGWEFDRYEREGALAVVDLDPVEMANSLDNIRGELPGLVEDFGADRLVLDSVSLLEMMYDDVARRRTEVFDFTRSLKEAGVTTFLTSEASEDNEYASRHGIIEYLTDAVFFLQYIRGESQETRLAVEIQKIRNANHSRERKPYEITAEGISVYQQANIF